MAKHLELGRKGEDLATEYLLKQGFTILERNWTYENAELDIIARDEDILVFVEVKTRTGNAYGDPEDAVDKRKISKILEAAEAYVEEKNLDNEIRFDIIAIVIKGGRYELEHIPDAIYPFDEGE